MGAGLDSCFVYLHTRQDINQPFYIGIGSDIGKKRAFTKDGRNAFWHRVVAKHPCESKIIYEGLTWKEACEIEINLIAHYGRIRNGGILVNLTDGGEGTLGLICSEEKKILISERVKQAFTLSGGNGWKGRQHKESTKEILRNRIFTQQWRGRLSDAQKKRTILPKTNKFVLDTNTGVFYDSLKEASFYNNIPESTLSARLTGRLKNNTNLTY
jgi:hypothetical protein